MTHDPRPGLTKSQEISRRKRAAREHTEQVRQATAPTGRSRLVRIVPVLAGVLLVALVTGLLISTARSGATTGVATGTPPGGTSLVGRAAPDFVMPDSAGGEVSLSSYRGRSAVILYFSEGAGCEACVMQMGAIEQDRSAFEEAGFVVLPIVMNTREQISADAQASGVQTPFLLDDGTASAAYGTLGAGMHEGLPGHSFVVVDKEGIVRWSGEYPSMWLEPSQLLSTASGAVD